MRNNIIFKLLSLGTKFGKLELKKNCLLWGCSNKQVAYTSSGSEPVLSWNAELGPWDCRKTKQLDQNQELISPSLIYFGIGAFDAGTLSSTRICALSMWYELIRVCWKKTFDLTSTSILIQISRVVLSANITYLFRIF